MNIEQIQTALFAAYDIRKTLTNSELQRPIAESSFDETIGENLEEIITALEQLCS